MASPAMDRFGNIGIGYSFGGTPHFAGQRFAGRRATDPLGTLGLPEVVLATGEAAQTYGLRWEDYSQTAIDPVDDCTIWYVGDYYRKGAENYSSRIGAFRMPPCGEPGERLWTPESLPAYDPVLFNLLGRVYAGHHIPADVYHSRDVRR